MAGLAHQPDAASPGGPPSGLFSRAAFARSVEAAGMRPRWWDDPVKRERRYLDWVEAEALGLSAQLGGLDGPDADPDVVRPLRTLTRVLARDAAWASGRRSGAGSTRNEMQARQHAA